MSLCPRACPLELIKHAFYKSAHRIEVGLLPYWVFPTLRGILAVVCSKCTCGRVLRPLPGGAGEQDDNPVLPTEPGTLSRLQFV